MYDVRMKNCQGGKKEPLNMLEMIEFQINLITLSRSFETLIHGFSLDGVYTLVCCVSIK